jgi:hypothetical protein
LKIENLESQEGIDDLVDYRRIFCGSYGRLFRSRAVLRVCQRRQDGGKESIED